MSSCSRPILWPKCLADIHLEEDEKETLDQKIRIFASRKEQNLWDLGDKDFSLSKAPSMCESLPRRVVFSGDRIFVVLNNRGGMPNFYEDGYRSHKIQYVWECYSGALWLKKRLYTPVELAPLKALASSPAVGFSELGLPGLAVDPTGKSMFDGRGKSKLRYFEKMAPCTLTQGLEKFGRTLHVKCLLGLIDAVRKIHLQKGEADGYSAYYIKIGHLRLSSNLSYTLFHGNISPDNILCEEFIDETTGETYPRLILSGFSRLGNLHVLNARKWGWNSPEYIYQSVSKEYYKRHDSSFSADYGAKRDTWALGLLLAYFFLGRYEDQCLPNFNFLASKLTFDESGKYIVDESRLAEITQKEIDLEIDRIIKGLPSEELKVVWGFIRGCLVVDPDLRPTIAQHYLKLEDLPSLNFRMHFTVGGAL